MSNRWAPSLPTLCGRAGPRSLVEPSSTFQQKLEKFYTDHRSCSSFFERGVPLRYVRYCESRDGPFLTPPFLLVGEGRKVGQLRPLRGYSPDEQYVLLVRSFYYRVSDAFRRRLKSMLWKSNGLNQVKQWFYTADAVVMPYLLTAEDPSDIVADELSKFALENCANNYSHFLKELKTFKKTARKAFAMNSTPQSSRVIRRYQRVMYSIQHDGADPVSHGRFLLTWTQTRAAGLADGKMIRASIEKLEQTVCTPAAGDKPILNPKILLEACRGMLSATGTHAKLSVGSTACVEYTRERGGKTAMLSHLTGNKVLKRTFDPVTLNATEFPARSCRNAQDVFSWAIGWVLDNPQLARIRRVHAVAEPSKARTIGVPPYAVSVLFGIAAHIVAPTLKSKGVKSGLKSSRHLWNFLRDNLDPQELDWSELAGSGRLFALSTDEETATDFGDLRVSDQVWSAFAQLGSAIEGFPLGFFALCKWLYKRSRIYLVPIGGGNYRPFVSSRGWPMGDLFTKIILTVVNDYGCRLSGVRVYSLVGDDLIALSRLRIQLQRLLENLEAVGMKISEDDTFISHRLAFYCEEGTLVPQEVYHTPRVQMRRRVELFYLDYPRIRLMIPTQSETDAYSSSNVGRFSLLGKESSWVFKNNLRASALFARALLIQHIVVPQEADTLCPFVPIEIGGDGAFPPSTDFLRSVLSTKVRGRNAYFQNRNMLEIRFRMVSLLENKFSQKLVRSERLDSTIKKHHLLLSKVEDLSNILPAEAIVRPQSDAARQLMNSVQIPFLEAPSQTFVRLCREAYYRFLFQGRKPPEPTFDISRYFGPRGTKVLLNVSRFRSTWLDPGFIYHNFEPYYVNKDIVVPQLTTGLGWQFNNRRLDQIEGHDSHIWSNWVRENLTLQDQSIDDLMRYLNGNPLHPRVADRLSKYFESDVYVVSQINVEDDVDYVIVTRDIKLCDRVRNIVNTPERALTGTWAHIYALDPMLYLVGRTDEALGLVDIRPGYKLLEDAGAIIHCDYTEFQDGSPVNTSLDKSEERLEALEMNLFIGEISVSDSRFGSWIRKIELPRI